MASSCFFNLAPDSGLDPRQTQVPASLNQTLSAPLFTLVTSYQVTASAYQRSGPLENERLEPSFHADSRGFTLRNSYLHLYSLFG